MTRRLNVARRQQNSIVCSGKSEAEVTKGTRWSARTSDKGQNPKIGQVWRPVAPQPYVVQKTRRDPGNYLALGLQRGVNSISLQCIPWPVACSEWGACLTDFDRSSTFRFFGTGIRTMIQIGLKSWSVRPCPDTCRHAKFHPNPCTRFWVILMTDRQRDRQTNIAGNRTHCQVK